MLIAALTLAGVVISVVVGTLWYSPMTPMGRLHMRALGFDTLSTEEQAAKMAAGKALMPKLYAAQVVLSALTSFAVTFIVLMMLTAGIELSFVYGVIAFDWLGFVVPIIGGSILWGNIDRSIAWKKFVSDSAENFVVLMLVTFVTTLFV